VKRLAWYTAIVLLTMGGMLLLWEFREAAMLFFLSLALAAVFRPLIQGLKNRGFPQVAAVMLPYLIAILVLGSLIYLAWGPLMEESQRATDNLAVSYARLLNQWSRGSPFQQAIADQLPLLDDLSFAVAGEQGEALVQGVLGVASNVFAVGSSVVIVLVLSMYWSADRVYFERFWLSILPVRNRTRAREAWRDIETGVGEYLRSEIFQLLLAVILLGLLYRLIGVQYPTLLALLGGLAWLIPWAGAILAMVPPFLVGLGTNLGVAVAGALVTLVVLLFLELIVERRMVNKRSNNSLLVVLMLIAMVDVFGFMGVFIAPPLSAAIQSAGRRLWIKPVEEARAEPEVEIAKLRSRLIEAQEMAANLEKPAPHLSNMIERINKLIERSEEVLQNDFVR
jgi:predicted PurR-regulated permease PerM